MVQIRNTQFPRSHQSGLEADRPAAEDNRGGRYYATDTQTIFVSYGTTWHQVSTLDPNKADVRLDGTLVDRPDPSTCIGALYVDEDGLQYEAFPTAWATVNQEGQPAPPVEDGQLLFDFDHMVSFDAGHRQLCWANSSDAIALDWSQPGVILLPVLPTGDPSVVGQLWNNAGVLQISAGGV